MGTCSVNGQRQTATLNYAISTKWETKPSTTPQKLLDSYWYRNSSRGPKTLLAIWWRRRRRRGRRRRRRRLWWWWWGWCELLYLPIMTVSSSVAKLYYFDKLLFLPRVLWQELWKSTNSSFMSFCLSQWQTAVLAKGKDNTSTTPYYQAVSKSGR